MDYIEIKTKLIQAIIDEMEQVMTPTQITDRIVVLESVLDHQTELLDFVANMDTPPSIYVEELDEYHFYLLVRVSNRKGVAYELKFYDKPDLQGYCQCEPDDEGYNPVHKCCGTDCDWYIPGVHITKVEDVDVLEFEGLECHLWEAKDQFMDKYFGDGSAYKQQLMDESSQLFKDIEYCKARILEASMRIKCIDDELGGID